MTRRLACLLLVACRTAAPSAPTPGVEAAFRETAEELLTAHLEANPSAAVRLGFHEYDGRLPDRSPDAIAAEIERLRAAKAELETFHPSDLSPTSRVERDVLRFHASARLFELAVRRLPFTNPMGYVREIDLAPYINFDYAPLAQRAAAVIAICHGAKGWFERARENLEPRLPRVSVETALMSAEGVITFIDGDVRREMAGVPTDLAPELDAALAECTTELGGFRDFLRERLASATDDYALGEAAFLDGLAETQGLRIDLARLKAIAEADLARNLAAVEEAAHAIDPTRPAAEVVDRVLDEDRPRADQAVDLASAQLVELRRFVVDHDLVTVPSDEAAEVRETPPFMRFNQAFLEPPGAFEQRSFPSFYYVTPPDPKWPAEEQRRYVSPRAVLLFNSVHEVWPGHFLHQLHKRKNPSRILKAFCNVFMSEGWAHYTEEMTWDEGLGAGDPRVHLGQLSTALLRDVRFLAAIGLHAEGMTVAEAEALFREKALVNAGTARQQARRGTFDPMYLSYTVGKLMILKLRADLRAKEGKAFSLKRFHDQFLSYGCAPVPVIREAMLGEGAGPPL